MTATDTDTFADYLRDKNWQLLDIPEATVGTFRIVHERHEPGSTFPTANLRCSLLAGQPRIKMTFEHPVVWTKLVEGNGVWMTDMPCEQVQLDRHLPDLHGSVLVGGLGLGYAVTKLAERDEVSEIVVVERSPEVIELVAKHLDDRGKMQVVENDIHAYVASCDRTFDCAFYDTWAPDTLGVFFEEVVPLLQASDGVILDTIACWNEDVMRGQLRNDLLTKMLLLVGPELLPEGSPVLTAEKLATPDDGEGSIHWNWRVPFFEAIRDGKVKPTDQEQANWFADNYGRSGWEDAWKRRIG